VSITRLVKQLAVQTAVAASRAIYGLLKCLPADGRVVFISWQADRPSADFEAIAAQIRSLAGDTPATGGQPHQSLFQSSSSPMADVSGTRPAKPASARLEQPTRARFASPKPTSAQPNKHTRPGSTIPRTTSPASSPRRIVFLTHRRRGGLIGHLLFASHWLAQIWQFSRAGVVFVDCYCPLAGLLNHRPSLQLIQIWHALGAFKYFGWSNVDQADGWSAQTSLPPRWLAETLRMHHGYTTVVVSHPSLIPAYAEAFAAPPDIFQIGWLPRIFALSDRRGMAEQARTVRQRHPELAETTPPMTGGRAGSAPQPESAAPPRSHDPAAPPPQPDPAEPPPSIPAKLARPPQQLGSATKPVILYAPTWRQARPNPTTTLATEQLLRGLSELGHLIVKPHPRSTTETPQPCRWRYRTSESAASATANHQQPNRPTAPPQTYPNPDPQVAIGQTINDYTCQELLAIADLVITDYSAIIFEAYLADRPVFGWQPDIDSYQQERGCYTDPRDLPSPTFTDASKLIAAINQTMIDPNQRQIHLAAQQASLTNWLDPAGASLNWANLITG
jgi:CDP-ribitol ribitolphosphotransferase